MGTQDRGPRASAHPGACGEIQLPVGDCAGRRKSAAGSHGWWQNAVMRFEHLLQVNDPLMPLLDPLSRSQVWRGLVLRVAEPVSFLPGLRQCDIGERTVEGGVIQFQRTMDFGNFTVRDRVKLTTLESIEVTADATEHFAASHLRISIEQPGSDTLFVRFIYELAQQDNHDGLDAMTNQARRQAWELSDIDTIRRIRELAQRGDLD